MCLCTDDNIYTLKTILKAPNHIQPELYFSTLNLFCLLWGLIQYMSPSKKYWSLFRLSFRLVSQVGSEIFAWHDKKLSADPKCRPVSSLQAKVQSLYKSACDILLVNFSLWELRFCQYWIIKKRGLIQLHKFNILLRTDQRIQSLIYINYLTLSYLRSPCWWSLTLQAFQPNWRFGKFRLAFSFLLIS